MCSGIKVNVPVTVSFRFLEAELPETKYLCLVVPHFAHTLRVGVNYHRLRMWTVEPARQFRRS